MRKNQGIRVRKIRNNKEITSRKEKTVKNEIRKMRRKKCAVFRE